MKKSKEVGAATQPPIPRDPPQNEYPDIVIKIVLWLFGLGIIYILFMGGFDRAAWFLLGGVWGLPSLACFAMALECIRSTKRKEEKDIEWSPKWSSDATFHENIAKINEEARLIRGRSPDPRKSLGKFIMFAVLFLGLAYQSYASFKYAVTGEGKPPTLNLGSGEYSRR